MPRSGVADLRLEADFTTREVEEKELREFLNREHLPLLRRWRRLYNMLAANEATLESLEFVLGAASPLLPNARLFVDSASVTWDLSVDGEVSAAAAGSGGGLTAQTAWGIASLRL